MCKKKAKRNISGAERIDRRKRIVSLEANSRAFCWKRLPAGGKKVAAKISRSPIFICEKFGSNTTTAPRTIRSAPVLYSQEILSFRRTLKNKNDVKTSKSAIKPALPAVVFVRPVKKNP